MVACCGLEVGDSSTRSHAHGPNHEWSILFPKFFSGHPQPNALDRSQEQRSITILVPRAHKHVALRALIHLPLLRCDTPEVWETILASSRNLVDTVLVSFAS